MVTQASDLVAIRQQLLSLFADEAASLGVTHVTYQAIPQGKPWPIAGSVVRAAVLPPNRSVIAAEAEPMVQQDGQLVLSWLFPRDTGMVDVTAAIESTIAIYREQTLAGGVMLTGDATASRIGNEGDRLRWDVRVAWRTQRIEPAASDTDMILGTQLPTLPQALAAVRSLWLERLEQADDGSGWPGLTTFYDNVGPFQKPPPIPWAGYWCSAFGTSTPEIGARTETVLGNALVSLHTDKDLGTAGAEGIAQRVIAEHNRTTHSVRLGIVQPIGALVSGAGTWQTNLRVPFQFERLRAS